MTRPDELDPYSEELMSYGMEEYAFVITDMAEQEKKSKQKKIAVRYGSFEKWYSGMQDHPAATLLIMWHNPISSAEMQTSSHRHNMYVDNHHLKTETD